MKKSVHVIGLVVLVVGCFIILNTFTGITGFSIISADMKMADSTIGLALVVIGALVFTRF